MRTLLIATLALAAVTGCASPTPPPPPLPEAAPAELVKPAVLPSASPTRSPGSSSPSASPSAPASSPSASATPPVRSIRSTDWRNATLRGLTACGGGDVRFRHGQAEVNGYSYTLLPHGSHPAYGDADGDGDIDAVLSMRCGPANSSYGSYLVAVDAHGTRRLVLGTVSAGDFTMSYTAYRVAHHTIHAHVRTHNLGTVSNEERRYRWTGSHFE